MRGAVASWVISGRPPEIVSTRPRKRVHRGASRKASRSAGIPADCPVGGESPPAGHPRRGHRELPDHRHRRRLAARGPRAGAAVVAAAEGAGPACACRWSRAMVQAPVGAAVGSGGGVGARGRPNAGQRRLKELRRNPGRRLSTGRHLWTREQALHTWLDKGL